MIGYLKGQIKAVRPDFCLLETGGVGYRVFVAGATLSRLRVGETAELYTHLSVTDTAMTLYGFSTAAEYDFFQLLIGVSGIGPKLALGILGAATVDTICGAIAGKQAALLTKLPGIGKKTAERMILELKDKVASFGGEVTSVEPVGAAIPVGDDMENEAIAALQSLGYSAAEIVPLVKKAVPAPTVEAIIRKVLKEFARR